MWPPEREHTQKLSNEEMVHNCLLAPNNLGRRVTCEGNTTFTFPLQQPTVILHRPRAPTPGTGFSSSTTTHHLWKNYCFVLTLPGVSKLTHDFTPCRTASCFCSGFFLCRVLRAAGRAGGSSVCLAVTAPQPNHHRTTKAESPRTKEVTADALHRVQLATHRFFFSCC